MCHNELPRRKQRSINLHGILVRGKPRGMNPLVGLKQPSKSKG